MKALITLPIAFTGLFSASAFAATKGYDLKMDLSMNGQHISSPHVETKEGEKAEIIQNANGEQLFMDVVATEKPVKDEKTILMKFVVGKIAPNGDKKILSSPQIVTLENEKAVVMVNDGEILLSINATRKSF